MNNLIIQRWKELEKVQTIIGEILHQKQISKGERKMKISKEIVEKNFKKYEKLIGKKVQEEIKASIDKSKESAPNETQNKSLWSNIRQGVKDSHKKVLEELSKNTIKEIHESLKNKNEIRDEDVSRIFQSGVLQKSAKGDYTIVRKNEKSLINKSKKDEDEATLLQNLMGFDFENSMKDVFTPFWTKVFPYSKKSTKKYNSDDIKGQNKKKET